MTASFDDPRLPPRFWAKATPEPNSGCWLWHGSSDGFGYGRSNIGCRTLSTHRMSYELLVGLIPPGLHLDHLCRTPACMNPAHLEPVTCRENLMRGATLAAANAAKITCAAGHPLPPRRTRPDEPYRCCRICATEAAEQRRVRLQAAGLCKHCGSAAAAPGRLHCPMCLEKARVATKLAKCAKRGGPPRRQRPDLETHCTKGHRYDESNPATMRNGTRKCRACARARTQAWRDQRRAEAPP